ncbi:MAG: 3-hydroxyacyl-CoA dehydrogenase family protein [Spirochaetes bacterium]|nr:3-hydroxyacyl-CoA dehydrogenase family protein [Spirochaetota bacterium]NMB64929.1 3-hydroxyacyl-CoA dehydrogenase family protein [Spirochaetota bacterium]HOJ28810.1 3-hydroxyacyl-CoA dehydrogenase family protein [Spirochaetota bacterium]HOM10590.1 3-hydroxyacyl-CoA dehydrogenase family protein [Spirochaetota bacterium]HPP49197.1 3-hydroxyacyl-CoA dehydrogenase family protein [Spirochaetota bacterium]
MQSINDVKKIAVIGSGAMGHGIAQVCAQNGLMVTMIDIKQEFLDNALKKVKESLDFLASKGKLQGTVDEILGKISVTTDLQKGVSDAQVIIEAVPENMQLKKDVFAKASSACASDAILATNTSTMSITEIATAVTNPERFAGMHFFNPVTRMKLVELIYGAKTSENAINILFELTKKIDKFPVKVLKDRPGFIVNRISAPNQALLSAILDEGKIHPAQIDGKMKKMGVKMAPFETADFVGLDVFCHTLEYYAQTLSPQYKPGKFLLGCLDKGHLGMKSGKGIYEWKDGKAIIPEMPDTEEITPLHLMAVQVNEAVKVYKEGIAASVQDIDDGVKYGMNAFAGPFALASGVQPQQLTDCLNYLAQRFKLDILKPEPEIIDGSFKTIGR